MYIIMTCSSSRSLLLCKLVALIVFPYAISTTASGTTPLLRGDRDDVLVIDKEDSGINNDLANNADVHKKRSHAKNNIFDDNNKNTLRNNNPSPPSKLPSSITVQNGDESDILTSQPETNKPEDVLTKQAHQTDIIYENNNLQMIVEQGAFKRQNRFRLQDHLFYLKIKLKNPNDPVPLLKDILLFLEQGLLHVMDKIKVFYNEKDANICFLTLHQNPMLIGLNSGI